MCKDMESSNAIIPRQWPKEYDLCHTFFWMKHVQFLHGLCHWHFGFELAQHAKTCYKI